mgnify:CR=1 FL=1
MAIVVPRQNNRVFRKGQQSLLNRLQQHSGGQKTMAPLPDHGLTKPGTVFKPHKMAKPVNSIAGFIANPEENGDA